MVRWTKHNYCQFHPLLRIWKGLRIRRSTRSLANSPLCWNTTVTTTIFVDRTLTIKRKGQFIRPLCWPDMSFPSFERIWVPHLGMHHVFFDPLHISALICSFQFLFNALAIVVYPATSLRKAILAFPGAPRCSTVQHSNPLKYGCAKMWTVCPVTSSFFFGTKQHVTTHNC